MWEPLGHGGPPTKRSNVARGNCRGGPPWPPLRGNTMWEPWATEDRPTKRSNVARE